MRKNLHPRRICLEELESRQLLSITFPSIGDQSVQAGAPLNVALQATESNGHPIQYVAMVTDSTMQTGQFTAAVPQGNRSLRISVYYEGAEYGDEIEGDMVFQLADDLAPDAVDQIVSLVDDYFYDYLTFHRVIDGFMIQGGDPDGDGTGGPGYSFDDQFSTQLQFTGPGILALANSGSDTNGSQFFITTDSYRYGDFRYTIIGFLTEGADILDQLQHVPVEENAYGTELSTPEYEITIDTMETFVDDRNGVLRLFAANDVVAGSCDVTIVATDTVTYEAVSQTIRVYVSEDGYNDPPFLDTIAPIVTTVNTPITIQLPGVDVEGDAIYYAGVSDFDDLELTVDSSTGLATITPTHGIVGVYSIYVGVRPTDSNNWDTQMVPVYIAPSAPTKVTLASDSDSGVSDSDHLTQWNSGLAFEIEGAAPDAWIDLYANGTWIGGGYADDTTTTIYSDFDIDLADGYHIITATQTLEDLDVEVGNLETVVNLTSPASPGRTVLIDTTSPEFNFTPVTTVKDGDAYRCQVSVLPDSSGSVEYFLMQSPLGMTINSQTGLISWTASLTGGADHEVVVVVADAADNLAFKSFTIHVAAKQPEITVLYGSTVLASGAAAPITALSAIRGGVSPSITLTIRNDGDAALYLTAPFEDTSHFTVSDPKLSSLAPGQSTTFTITLKTEAAWSGVETISFLNNDGDNDGRVESPFTFVVSGTVAPLSATMTVFDGTTQVVNGATKRIDIGDAVRDGVPASKTFTIRNDGDLTLVLNSDSFADTAHFTVGQPSTTTVAAGQTATFVVALKTGAVWSGYETISFTGKDAGAADSEARLFTFVASGAVAKKPAEISVFNGAVAIADGQMNPVVVGSAARGEAGPSITITIRNDGDESLRLYTPFASTEHFIVSRPTKTFVAAGTTATFTVTLNTSAVWSGTESISFTNGDEDNGDGVESPFTFVVSGVVTPMSAEVSVLDGATVVTSGATKQFSLGSATRGAEGPIKTFTIRNDGDQPLVLDRESFVDTAHFIVGQPLVDALAAGQSTTFVVTLKTGEIWSGNEQVSFVCNDGDNGDGVESPFTFVVSGRVTAMPPEITVLVGEINMVDGQADPIELGEATRMTVGDSAVVTIRNDGDRSLRLARPFASTEHVIVGQPGDILLSPGESTTFTVQLNTAQLWSGVEEVLFYSTDADNGDGVESPFRILVSGSVVLPENDQTTIGGYEPVKSIFHLRTSNSDGAANFSVQYGPARSGWIPITGDWDGNGVCTVGLYNPKTSTFYLRNTNTPGVADVTFVYGPAGSGWTPIVGDWNGDGRDTIGLYNPKSSTFYLHNTNAAGVADVTFVYGPAGSGWTPIAGDWDGDRRDTIGLYNQATSVFFLRNTNTQGVADERFSYGPASAGWTPVVGDWNGDGRETVGLYAPNTTRFYLRYENTQGVANSTFDYSLATRTWIPLTGVWTLGDMLLEADSIGTSTSVLNLSQSDLQPIVAEAMARWAGAGVDAAALARMSQVEFVVADLPDAVLGKAAAERVTLDVDAAGHGWFVDSTPGDDAEFAGSSAIDPKAVDRIDLLTVIEHELGHVAGLEDIDALVDGVMNGVLGVGTRRNP